MELRLKPFGFMAILLITLAAVVFDVTEWAQVQVATRHSTGRGHLVLLASSASGSWLQKQVDRFNSQNKGKVDITIRFKDSAVAMNDILSARDTPTMWAPSGAEWAGRLGDLWAIKHKGDHLVDVTDEANFRTYFRTPLVLVSKKNGLAPARAAMAGAALSAGTPAPAPSNGTLIAPEAPSVACRVAFPDPESSDTGRMTIGMILSNYALRNSVSSDDLDGVAKSAGFLQFLRELHDTPVTDSFTQKGGSGALDALIHNPKFYDVVAAPESEALAAAAKDPTLVVSYPTPTCVADQSVAVLSGARWVSADQQAAARSFLRFLSTSDSLAAGVKAHFRPTHPTAQLTLAGDLKAMRKRGFRQVFDSVDPLPYGATEDAAHAWRIAAAGAEAHPTARIIAFAR